MDICLQKANFADCPDIHRMQAEAFLPLLEKYGDYETNPGAESLDRIERRMEQPFTDYYFIMRRNGMPEDDRSEREKIGVLRVVRLDENACRISPMFVLPAYQNNGYAQRAICCAESLYPLVSHWELDTILQEKKLCHLYEKAGYIRTGKEREIQPDMTIVYYEKRILIEK